MSKRLVKHIKMWSKVVQHPARRRPQKATDHIERLRHWNELSVPTNKGASGRQLHQILSKIIISLERQLEVSQGRKVLDFYDHDIEPTLTRLKNNKTLAAKREKTIRWITMTWERLPIKLSSDSLRRLERIRAVQAGTRGRASARHS